MQRHARDDVSPGAQVVPCALRARERQDQQPQVVQAAPQLNGGDGGPHQQGQQAHVLPGQLPLLPWQGRTAFQSQPEAKFPSQLVMPCREP